MSLSCDQNQGDCVDMHAPTTTQINLSLLLLLLSCFSRVRLCATPETAAHQAPPSLGFSSKNTGVGCHFRLQCMKVKSESEVSQSCPTLLDHHGLQPTRLLPPWDCPGKSSGVGCHHLLHNFSQGTIKYWKV